MEQQLTRVYVVGVPIYLKKKFFLKLFAQEGIRDVFILHGKRKGLPNSAFLTFETPEQAAAALKQGKIRTGKRVMKLMTAHKWHEQKIMRRQPASSTPGPSQSSESQHLTSQVQHTPLKSLAQLTIEALIIVASTLPFCQRARMEGVNKSWQEGSTNSYRGITTISTDSWQWRKCEDSWLEGEDVKVSLDCFNWAMNRFGRYLKSLAFHKGSALTSTAVTLAAKACKGLERLDLTHIRIREAALRELALNQTMLKSLTIGACDGPIDPELSELMLRNPKLKELTMVENNTTGKSLMAGTQLEQLTLIECNYLNSAAVVTAVEGFKNLIKLILMECESIFHQDLRNAIITNENLRVTLKQLVIRSGGRENQIIPDGLGPLQQGEWRVLDENLAVQAHNFGQSIASVEYLELMGCAWMQEHLLIDITNHTQHLKYLDLSLCTNLQDQFALDCLSNLKELENLKINGMHPLVGGTFFNAMINLKSVECRDNAGITDEDICGLLINAPKLTYLDLEGTFNITRMVVVKVYELLKRRPRYEKFTMRLGGTKAMRVRKDKANMYLKIDYLRESKPLDQYVDA